MSNLRGVRILLNDGAASVLGRLAARRRAAGRRRRVLGVPPPMVFEALEGRVLLTSVTFDSTTPTPIPIGAVKAGQVINLSVNFATTDNQEGFEGEPLVLVPSAGGAITIAAFGQQTIPLPIVQDGETLSGFVVGADGDELATVGTVASGQIQINDTATTTDNVTLYNPPTATMPFVQTIPAKIINTSATTETFALSVVQAGTGNVTLSQSSVTLAPGASTDITVTPTADSSAANDVHIIATDNGQKVAEDDMTVVSVQMSKYIYNSDTPAKMVEGGFYRIPPTPSDPETLKPSMMTPTTVQVTPALTGSGQFVTLLVTDQGDVEAGNAFVDSEVTENLTATKVVNIDGGNQTRSGHAAHLQLTAQVHGENTIQSAGFSVSSIPINYVVTFKSDVGSGGVGFVVNTRWSSDDGFVFDLDGIMLSEVVQYSTATGVFTNPTPANNSDYNTRGDYENGIDTHSRTDEEITAGASKYNTTSGKLIAEQVFMFNDSRTGAMDIPMQNSGYLITRTVYAIEGNLYCTTSKVGAAVTANGVSSAAGSGTVFKTQLVGPVPPPPVGHEVRSAAASPMATPDGAKVAEAVSPAVGAGGGTPPAPGALVVGARHLPVYTPVSSAVTAGSTVSSFNDSVSAGVASSGWIADGAAASSDDASLDSGPALGAVVATSNAVRAAVFAVPHWLKGWARGVRSLHTLGRHRP